MLIIITKIPNPTNQAKDERLNTIARRILTRIHRDFIRVLVK